jgi:hypothetical protein
VRWALERIRRELINVGKNDPVAALLAAQALKLIDSLKDVLALLPNSGRLNRLLKSALLSSEVFSRGIEALGWIVDERGLGGGQEQNGLAWQLPLEQLWESYVESLVRKEVAIRGGEVKVGRLRETVFPLYWTDPTHRSLGHLVPDVVVRRGPEVWIIDAKYKAHLAEIDETGWRQFTEDLKESHRADIHQALAYAALYEAKTVTATLMYPLRIGTWESLSSRGRDRSIAELFTAGRQLRLELRGVPFGFPG